MDNDISFAPSSASSFSASSPSPKKMILPLVVATLFLLFGGAFFIMSQNIATLENRLEEKLSKEEFPTDLMEKMGKMEEFMKMSEEKNLGEIGVGELKPEFAMSLVKAFETIDGSVVETQTELEKLAFFMQQILVKNFSQEEQTKLVEEFLIQQKLKEKEKAATPRESIDWLGAKVKTESSESSENTTIFDTTISSEKTPTDSFTTTSEEKPEESSLPTASPDAEKKTEMTTE